jgi:hypothetical protein
LNATHTSTPWIGGTNSDAQVQSVAGATILMSTFIHTASKDGKSYTSTIVGTSPFDKTLKGTTINAVVVPLIFPGSVPFDPTLPDLCDGGISSLTRFQKSPLTQNSPITMEGQNVGNTQFVNGFRRAEFWLTINGSAAYQNTINFTYSQAVTLAAPRLRSNRLQPRRVAPLRWEFSPPAVSNSCWRPKSFQAFRRLQ